MKFVIIGRRGELYHEIERKGVCPLCPYYVGGLLFFRKEYYTNNYIGKLLWLIQALLPRLCISEKPFSGLVTKKIDIRFYDTTLITSVFVPLFLLWVSYFYICFYIYFPILLTLAFFGQHYAPVSDVWLTHRRYVSMLTSALCARMICRWRPDIQQYLWAVAEAESSEVQCAWQKMIYSVYISCVLIFSEEKKKKTVCK